MAPTGYTKDIPYDIYLFLKNKFQGGYDPLLFHFDFIHPGERGIFPLFNFPTLNTIDTITNGKQFLESLQSQLEDFYAQTPILSQLKFYSNPTKFLKKNFANRNIYTQVFLIRAALIVDLSNKS